MKKPLMLFLPLLLISCAGKNTEKVQRYHYAYQTSEVQEYTHDVKVAEISDERYVEVPEDCDESEIAVEHTGKVVYYFVYGIEGKVSNKGWEIVWRNRNEKTY